MTKEETAPKTLSYDPEALSLSQDKSWYAVLFFM